MMVKDGNLCDKFFFSSLAFLSGDAVVHVKVSTDIRFLIWLCDAPKHGTMPSALLHVM